MDPRETPLPAVVTAGDQRAAKAVYGESKVYLEMGGHALVAHTVAALQNVPEVSEVWVVGDAARLEKVLGEPWLRERLRKPLTIVPQFRNLFENAWQTYRRLLPEAGPGGRDPRPEEAERPVLFLSGDLPFATPQEISAFVRRGLESGADYALGVVPEEAMEGFYPRREGEPGVRMAYFNMREGRFRQSNLHLVRPGHLGNRHYIEEMYEHRHQKQIGNMIALGWRILWREGGGPSMVFYYLLMHLASIVDRRGWRGLADALRRFIALPRVERAVSRLLRTRFRVVQTEVGGCAVDIDKEADYDAARERFEAWRSEQQARAERILGPPPLAAEARRSEPATLRVLPRGERGERS